MLHDQEVLCSFTVDELLTIENAVAQYEQYQHTPLGSRIYGILKDAGAYP